MNEGSSKDSEASAAAGSRLNSRHFFSAACRERASSVSEMHTAKSLDRRLRASAMRRPGTGAAEDQSSEGAEHPPTGYVTAGQRVWQREGYCRDALHGM